MNQVLLKDVSQGIPLVDGIIELDSERGKPFDFVSAKFDGWLWKKAGSIYISFIVSKKPGKGNLRTLFEAILKEGYAVKVPTPFARMEMIVKKMKFKQIFEPAPEYGKNEFCEVWIKSPTKDLNP